MSVVSARTFNQSPSAVKRMAMGGPVFVTERGRTALVVLSVEEYERITTHRTTHDTLAMDDDVEVELEPVISRDLGRVADL